MNLSQFFAFLRARPVLLVSLAALALAIGAAQSCRVARHGPASEILATFGPGATNLHLIASRKTAEILPILPRENSHQPATPLPAGLALFTNPPNPMLSLHAPADTNSLPTGPYLPTGRLVPCQLVSALDSATPNTPIIGFVAQDVWWGGDLVLPRGTEVHGRAQLDRVRDRIVSQERWVIIWQTGEELAISGSAMQRDFDFTKRSWGPTDCTPGLAGQIIRSSSLDEIKLFLATALSGVAAGMQQQSTTVLGFQQIPSTARNLGLTATSQVLTSYSQQVLEAIKRDGLFVHVPAGQFYLYLHEPLDRLKARIASGRIPSETTVDNSRQATSPPDSAMPRTIAPLPSLSVPSTAPSR